MDETKFRETEAKYKDLKEKHSRGEISTSQVKADLKKLMVQDENGTYWMLGGKSGKWYRHDGSQWQEADPYEMFAKDDEPPFELNNAQKISQDSPSQPSAAGQDDAIKTESKENEKMSQAADVSDISYTPYATETSGNSETATDIDVGDISYPSFGTESSTVKKESSTQNSTQSSTQEDSSLKVEDTYQSSESNNYQDDYSIPKEYEGEEQQAHISLESFEVESEEKSDESDILDTGEPIEVTESIKVEKTGTSDDESIGNLENNDAFGTFQIDSTEQQGGLDDGHNPFLDDRQNRQEELQVEEQSLEEQNLTVTSVEETDTKRFEYTVHKEEASRTEIPMESHQQVQVESQETEPPQEPKPAQASLSPLQESQDFITCGICKSRIPPYAVYCTFCGAHQKSLKQRTSLKTAKEEGELLIKSIKITSFLFFLGGLGLIVGIILGAIFGVFKEFMVTIAENLPMMLSETRGGPAGGLIFAAIGGIGGFILSAVSAVILSAIYNLIAFIFGGIRFKIKR